MTLDSLTIAVITVVMTAIVGVLMLVSWLENRAMRPWLWWGIAYLCLSTGFVLIALRTIVGVGVSIALGNALVLAGGSMIWIGARLFEGRVARIAWIAAAPAIWIGLCQIPSFAADVNMRVVVASFAMTALALLTAREFWLGRPERLGARTGILVLLAVYVLLLMVRMALTIAMPMPERLPLAASGWFMQSVLSGLILGVLLGFLLLILPRQRVELRYKTAALVDPLTGLANRRAFLEQAEHVMRSHVGPARPVAVLIFDLDRFKEINDCHGHAAGDLALQIFANVIVRQLRTDDLAGRLGGEEFAALLPGTDLDTAVAIGELIRERFAQEAAEVDGQRIHATVSVGVASTQAVSDGIGELLARADMALYRAKRSGRDRVEATTAPFGHAADDQVDGPPLVPVMG